MFPHHEDTSSYQQIPLSFTVPGLSLTTLPSLAQEALPLWRNFHLCALCPNSCVLCAFSVCPYTFCYLPLDVSLYTGVFIYSFYKVLSQQSLQGRIDIMKKSIIVDNRVEDSCFRELNSLSGNKLKENINAIRYVHNSMGAKRRGM